MFNHRNPYVILFLFDEGERPGADITLRFPSAHYASNNHFKAFLASAAVTYIQYAWAVQRVSVLHFLQTLLYQALIEAQDPRRVFQRIHGFQA